MQVESRASYPAITSSTQREVLGGLARARPPWSSDEAKATMP